MTLEYRCSKCGALLETSNADPLNEQRDTLLEAAKRALFILESPALQPLANGAGTVDLLRAAIAKVHS